MNQRQPPVPPTFFDPLGTLLRAMADYDPAAPVREMVANYDPGAAIRGALSSPDPYGTVRRAAAALDPLGLAREAAAIGDVHIYSQLGEALAARYVEQLTDSSVDTADLPVDDLAQLTTPEMLCLYIVAVWMITFSIMVALIAANYDVASVIITLTGPRVHLGTWPTSLRCGPGAVTLS